MLPHINKIYFSLILFFTSIFSLSLPAQIPSTENIEIFPVDQIRPGLTGTTYTVLQGIEIIPLETTILGVARNMLGPGMHLIIAKLTDEKTAITGAVHGMSGSPLFIDGKIVGALSRRIATFEKDGHCGYTPIADMLAVNRMMPEALPPIVARFPHASWFVLSTNKHSPASASHRFSFATKAPATARYLPTSLTRPSEALTHLTSQLRPLGLPITLAGLSPKAAELVQAYFPLPNTDFDHPIIPAGASRPASSARGKNEPLSNPDLLRPGSAVAAVMMTGDLRLGGTGTLTWRRGNRILGFGHPMYAFGQTQFPMANAEIISTIPSYYRPYKLSNIGPTLGTILEDRLSAIGGLIGPTPPLATYQIRREHNGTPLPTLTGEFINHPRITPSILGYALAAALDGSDETSSRILTADITGSLQLKELPTLDLSFFYSGQDTEIFQAIFNQVNTLLIVYQQEITPIEATHLDLHIRTSEKQHLYTIEKVATDFNAYPRSGTIRATITLRERLTDSTRTEALTIPIPENIRPGTTFTLRIAGSSELDALDTYPRLTTITDLAATIRTLNERRRTNALYAQILTPTVGQILDTRPMPSLPPSIYKLLERSTTSTQARPLRDNVWLEIAHPLPAVIQGSIDLSLQINRPPE
jgi:hypothetical protein